MARFVLYKPWMDFVWYFSAVMLIHASGQFAASGMFWWQIGVQVLGMFCLYKYGRHQVKEHQHNMRIWEADMEECLERANDHID